MAARSGAGTGVIVGLVVFVLSTVFLLVLTIVFYSKYTKMQDEKAAAESDLSTYITQVQANSDRFQTVVASAQQSGQSALQHMVQQSEAAMSKVLGNPNATVDDLNAGLNSYTSNQNASYLDVLQQLSSDARAAAGEADAYQEQIAALNAQIAQKNALLQQAEQNKDQEVQAVRDLIATYESDVQRYGTEVQETKVRMRELVSSLERAYDSQVETLEQNIDSLRSDLALKDQQLQVVRKIVDDIRMKMQNPAALVDATILDNENSQGQVFISRGRGDNIVLGMTFEVYDEPTQLRPDANGNFPRGKASLQVIEVQETTATAQITRSSRGRPVVRGDVLANAVYDPDKEYMFLVHGKFDVNSDGRPSEAEAEFIRNLVRDWGGNVVTGTEVRGDLDFLVLGVQPTRPMELRDNPSAAEVDRWVAQNQAYQDYNAMLDKAIKAGIPVLNQNRFFILIGHTNN